MCVANKKRTCYDADVPLQNCTVTIRDQDKTTHSVEVIASSLYEAVAIGLRTIRASEWGGNIPEKLAEITVSVGAIRVEHTVELREFNKWLARSAVSPADLIRRERVKQLLAEEKK